MMDTRDFVYVSLNDKTDDPPETSGYKPSTENPFKQKIRKCVGIVLLIVMILSSGIMFAEIFENPGQNEPMNVFECGSSFNDSVSQWGKIINGDESAPNNWPWAAALYLHTTQNLWSFNCGASLIFPSWALTAAHCLVDHDSSKLNQINSIKPKSVQVALGISNLKDAKMNLIETRKIILHPDYNTRTFENDIALIQLKEIPASKKVGYLCLDQDVHLEIGEELQTIGWGSTKINREGLSNVLNEVKLTILSSQMCDSFRGFNQSKKICAGHPSGESKEIKDACAGDSGGPAMVKRENRWEAAGIVSTGHKICNGIGTYTNVAYYHKWAMENIILHDKSIKELISKK